MSKDTIVQGDSLSKEDFGPRRLWSKETFVQGDSTTYFCPRTVFTYIGDETKAKVGPKLKLPPLGRLLESWFGLG